MTSPGASDDPAYAAIALIGPPALAWEVLRRMPGYGLDYMRYRQGYAGDDAEHAAFSRLWGVHFP